MSQVGESLTEENTRLQLLCMVEWVLGVSLCDDLCVLMVVVRDSDSACHMHINKGMRFENTSSFAMSGVSQDLRSSTLHSSDILRCAN